MRPIHPNRKSLELRRPEKFFSRTGPQRFHFENLTLIDSIVGLGLKATGLYPACRKNAEDVKLSRVEFGFDNLPEDFDGLRILFITDLHIDAIESLTDRIIQIAESATYDFCILGGDYSFQIRGDTRLSEPYLERLTQHLAGKSKVLGILGNHDEYRIGEFLADRGVEMLTNEHVCHRRGDQSIYLVGLDDCHYYGAADIDLAASDLPDDAFKIMLCHSPEFYKEAERAGFSLYLTGHTHGGQLCLPAGIAVVSCAAVPRRLVKGKWTYGQIKGYTSNGVGCTGVAARLFCPPEVVLITLRKT
jgi:predicted MPP superfamily phosphohydrolase